jgi:leucyl aminopeptidase
VLAAANAAAFTLPEFKSAAKPHKPARLESLRLMSVHGTADLREARAAAIGNNVARWLTALPPNVLTATAYRIAIDKLAKPYGIRSRFIGEPQLKRLGAGAFLAVARGNATRDAGILHLSYRPRGESRATLALVGKGVLFDTGGTNLKPFTSMLDMHTDMQGSAVALGTLLALAELRRRTASMRGLRSPRTAWRTTVQTQDLYMAANGTTIQVIHTDARVAWCSPTRSRSPRGNSRP